MGALMTNAEIAKSFKEAKNKAKQITILADLNLCTEEKIMEVLKKEGIDGRCLPRKRKATTNKTDSKTNDSMRRIDEVINIITDLKKKKDNLENQIKCINDALKSISYVCDDVINNTFDDTVINSVEHKAC